MKECNTATHLQNDRLGHQGNPMLRFKYAMGQAITESRWERWRGINNQSGGAREMSDRLREAKPDGGEKLEPTDDDC